jgi:eukaryotic-like serine/threonine-protein kinase
VTLTAGSHLGPYEVLSPLGAGGMGEVWKARDTRLSRDVAIKVLPAEAALDAERLKRFEKEARAASSLNHPNIVTLYEIGREGETSYIVMELVEGRTLREVVADGPLPARKVLSLASQIADGLARAHEAGIVHRDLKPENVMLTRDGHVKILDFGLAKLSQPEVDGAGTMTPTITKGTEPGMVMGTIGYMSPEQASGEALDYRSDQFSFGSVLYEMATGKRAFEGRTRPETLTAIIREEPAPAGTLNPKIPPPLAWIVERCLAKEPEGRYASSKDLARDLASVRDHLSEAFVSGSTAVAAPARSSPRIVAAAALAAALAAAFMAGRMLWRRAPAPPSFRRLTFRSGQVFAARFAPDGQTVVYGATWGNEPMTIFSTRQGSVESRALGAPGAQLLSISSSGEMLVLRDLTLARVSLAGGAEREIMDGVLDAAWAPNGSDIVVVRRPPSSAQIGATGSRLEFPIGKVLLETTYPLRSPRVSPRGDQVAFVERPFRGDMRGSLAVVDLNGKKRRLSEEFTRITDAAWSPRGDEIWFSAAAANESIGVHAVSLAGRERIVVKGPGSQVLQDVSPDGRVLLGHFHTRGVMKGLSPGQARESDLSWLDGSTPVALSDDGRNVLFSELGEGAGSLLDSVWKRPTDGSPAVRLGEGRAMGLSPDGKWALAVRLIPRPAQLLLIPTGAGETRILTQDQINHRAAAWFPDGRSVLFVGDEPGKGPRLYVQPIDGGGPRAISGEATKGTMWMTWRPISPDGRLVVFFDGQYLLYPVEGGPPRPIPGIAPGEVPIGWDSGGTALYVRDRQTPIRIFRLDVATGQRHPWKEAASPVPDVQLVMTPDGKSYAYGYDDSSSDLYLVEGLK